MKTKFHSKKSPSVGWFLFTIALVIISTAVVLPLLTRSGKELTTLYVGLPIATIFPGFFLWYWLDTWYSINEDTLHAKCGPFSWNISISDISKIRLNQKTASGTLKLSLSWRSMEICYGKHRSIMISPKREQEFLRQLKAANAAIEIKH